MVRHLLHLGDPDRLPRGARLNGQPDAGAVAARLRLAGCVFAEDEARLLLAAAGDPGELERLVARRVAGEPLETLLGWVDFLGRRLAVTPGVFVPRRRTGLLARLAAAYARPDGVVVELCCGVAPVAALVTTGEVHAAEVDPAAVACARENVPHGEVHLGDLYEALPTRLRGRVDVLAANAPYVPSAEIATMPPEAREHEPRIALDGGADGVDLHRRIAAGAPGWLAPGGRLLIETSPRQGDLTGTAMREAGLLTEVVTDPGIGGCVVVGLRPGERG